MEMSCRIKRCFSVLCKCHREVENKFYFLKRCFVECLLLCDVSALLSGSVVCCYAVLLLQKLSCFFPSFASPFTSVLRWTGERNGGQPRLGKASK